MNNINILILCSSRFALPAIREMVFARQLKAVAIPDHCVEIAEEVRSLLQVHAVPVLTLEKNSFEEQVKKAMKKYEINLCFVMTFGYKISASLYHTLPNGFFNVHTGQLPEYRGADPVFQIIKNREKMAGVTIHKFTDKWDAGDIVIKEMIHTDPGDTYGLLTAKISELAAKLTGTIIKMVSLGFGIPSKAQDESKAGYYKRQGAKDIVIDWETMDADAIVALVNACNPWNKGAVTWLNQKLIRILQAENISNEKDTLADLLPGTIAGISADALFVSTTNKGLLRVAFIYIDEGFLAANRLAEFGATTGSRFLTI